MKTCTKCGESKPTSEFGIMRDRGKTRLRPSCKPCKRAQDREYTNNVRDLARQIVSNQNWRDNNREYFNAWARAHYHEQQGTPVPFIKRRPWVVTHPVVD